MDKPTEERIQMGMRMDLKLDEKASNAACDAFEAAGHGFIGLREGIKAFLAATAAQAGAPEGWRTIESAKLGKKVMLWHPSWRSPFPGTPNGDNGAVHVDTPTPEHGGWQTFATHWQPIAPPARTEE